MGQDVERGQGGRSYSVIWGQPGFSESKKIESEVGGKARDEISFVSRGVTVPECTRECAGGGERQRDEVAVEARTEGERERRLRREGDNSWYRDTAPFLNGWLLTAPEMNFPTILYEAVPVVQCALTD
ncbi:UNVERIFIED_CONTAM: hypothetical protein FKN15_074463 [Acipenser sinensis]